MVKKVIWQKYYQPNKTTNINIVYCIFTLDVNLFHSTNISCHGTLQTGFHYIFEDIFIEYCLFILLDRVKKFL